MMRWIDMHCDTVSAVMEGNMGTLRNNSLCVDLNRLKEGKAAVQFFACFIYAGKYGNPDKGGYSSQVWDLAYEEAKRMIASAKAAQEDGLRFVCSKEDIGAELSKEKTETEQVKGVLTVEEGGVLNGKRERLNLLYEEGVRLLTLTWNYKNCIGSPNSRDVKTMEEGLTAFGKETVEQMNDLGMMIDVSHLSDGGFWDCIRLSRAPIAASHSNARSLCPHPRNLSDEMLHALGEQGGVAGINLYSAFLREGGRADLTDAARHAAWMIDKAGEDAVALGTDFDGFEREALPEGMEGVQDMERLWSAMERQGLTPRQIEKIAYGNALRVMREVF